MLLTRYITTQLYAGPEEGGWWWYRCVLDEDVPSLKFSDPERAAGDCRVHNQIEREEGNNDIAWHVEEKRGENTNTTKPHYE